MRTDHRRNHTKPSAVHWTALAFAAVTLLPAVAPSQEISKISRDRTNRPTLTLAPVLAPAHSLSAVTQPTSIRLRWACVNGPTGYDVYATPTGGATVKLTSAPIGPCLQDLQLSLRQDPRFPAPAPSYVGAFTHAGLKPGLEFTYFVRAIYPNGTADSEALTARSLWPAPASLTLAELADRLEIVLNWTPVSGARGYVVCRRTVWDAGFKPLTASPIAGTTHTDQWHSVAAAYYVKAVDGAPSQVAHFVPSGYTPVASSPQAC